MLGIRWVWFSMKSDSVETVPTDLVATALNYMYMYMYHASKKEVALCTCNCRSAHEV